MVRRALLLSLALLVAVFAPAASAQTPQYAGAAASATVTDDGILITGEGFIPNSTVTFQVEYDGFDGETATENGTTTADAQGDVSFLIANRGEGSYVVVLGDGVNAATTTIVVGQPGAAPVPAAPPAPALAAPAPAAPASAAPASAAPAARAGALPRTGADESVGLAQVGIAALGLGAVAVYAGKRRRANAWAA